jgi:hypothetical protein
MPFTPTHALAVVPLARVRALTPSALAIGSMIPDLWAFVPGAPLYSTSHSWTWGAISGVCYGLIAFVLFRSCRGPLIAFASERARRKLAAYAPPDLAIGARGWASVVISIVIGVWTHILWDSFTHAHALGTVWFPQLMTDWITVWGRPWRGHKVLQLGSAAVGLPILAWLVARWYTRLPVGPSASRAASFELRALGVALLVGVPVAVLGASWTADCAAPPAFELFVRVVVTRTISLYAVAAVALTLAVRRSL